MYKVNQFFLKYFPYQFAFFPAYSSYPNLFLQSNRKSKRGSMLSKMIVNRDKNKHWHFNLTEKAPNAKSVFEKVYRPNKRQNMLNSLFIKNISDVLSTSDVAPDIIGYGVEIKGVKISPCFKILNVYWQMPPNSNESHEKIADILNACGPRLRVELISRNVMGRVPKIFFIRDITNAKMAEFEKALKDIDLGPENELSIIPDEEFTKNLLSFKTEKASQSDIIKKQPVETASKFPKSNLDLPQRPRDMKSDVFGLKYNDIMSKVLASKQKPQTFPENSAVISSEFFPSADLFSKIPGTPLQLEEPREKLLKQFHIERKMMKNKKNDFKITKEDSFIEQNISDECEENKVTDNDYVDEDTSENFIR